jgi:uncharacterized membrane protein
MQVIEDGGDRVERGFDRLLALTGYGLLFVSVFLVWWPALIAAAIAWNRGHGADPRTASHFRFQMRIFWGELVLLGLGVAALIAGGGVAVGELWRVAAQGDGTWASWSAAAGARAVVLVVGGCALMALSGLLTLVLSGWGALRLVTGGGIGQSPRP